MKNFHISFSCNKTKTTYQNIIDRLIKEIKEAAISEGCSEDTLKELKAVRGIIN